MPNLDRVGVESISREAAGPVSFVAGGERFTRMKDGATCCATTYRTMMVKGWVAEVL